MAKFELFELRRIHEELQKSVVNMKKQNSAQVEPVLEKLRKEVRVIDTPPLRYNSLDFICYADSRAN